MLWWGVKKLMMVVHEKKPLPLVAPVLVVVVAFFNLDRLCNLFWMCRNKLCFIHLMDNVYVRHDRICIGGFRPSIWWIFSHFSLFYLVSIPFDGTISFFSFLWSLVLFRFPSNYISNTVIQYIIWEQTVEYQYFLSIGWIWEIVIFYRKPPRYFPISFPIFIWLVSVFSSVILRILIFFSSQNGTISIFFLL